MASYNDPLVSMNLNINYNLGGIANGNPPGGSVTRFISSVGTLMCRCLPLVILSALGVRKGK